MFNFSVVGDKAVISRMQARRAKLDAALTRTMTIQSLMLVQYIQKNKLQTSPLHHRSGRLQASIKQNVMKKGSAIVAKVYTNVKYAAIHEYGGKTPPHVIVPRNAKALSFNVKGKQVFAKKVNHPGSKMPERSFMRSSLKENAQKIKEAITKTIQGVMQNAA